MSDSLTSRLAEFVTDPQALPDSARQMMRLSFLDWGACAIAGIDEPVAQILRAQVLAEGGAPQASVIGALAHVPVRAAALVNGATSHALDYDDTHFTHIGHPSVAVIPAALSVAQLSGANGTSLLDAALIGAEVSIRIGVWLGRAHYEAGFHQTATAGAFGATAAAAHLLGLDRGQVMQALGLVSSRASGLKSQFGTMGKPYNAGIAASNGVEAALLAQAGFVSNPAGIETLQGFGDTHHGAADAQALDGLGQEFLMTGVSHKFHACCHGTHAMLETLRNVTQDIEINSIRAVDIHTNPRWMRVCNIQNPTTGLAAKFSYRLTAAMLLGGLDTAAPGAFDDQVCKASQIVALRDLVSVVADGSIGETAALVRVTLDGGQVISGHHDLMAPLEMNVRRDRLRAKAASLIGVDHAAALWDCIMADNGPEPKRLGDLLVAPRHG